jgi:hypothetical protein
VYGNITPMRISVWSMLTLPLHAHLLLLAAGFQQLGVGESSAQLRRERGRDQRGPPPRHVLGEERLGGAGAWEGWHRGIDGRGAPTNR